jgi:hypothetical protein
MRYFGLMGIRVASYAALMGLLAITATAASAAQAPPQPGADSISPARRFDGGASATVTVSARIIRRSASVGAGLGPPAPRMVPRTATVSAADGRAVPALVYDFE